MRLKIIIIIIKEHKHRVRSLPFDSVEAPSSPTSDLKGAQDMIGSGGNNEARMTCSYRTSKGFKAVLKGFN